MTSEPLKFIADAMLVRLAGWLLLLGYDVSCHSSLSDTGLIALAIRSLSEIED